MRKRMKRSPRNVRHRTGASLGQVWRAVGLDGHFRGYLVTDDSRCPTPWAWVPMQRGGFALATRIASTGYRAAEIAAIDLRACSTDDLADVLFHLQLHQVNGGGSLRRGQFGWASYFVPPSGVWAGELVFCWRVAERGHKKSGQLVPEATTPKPGQVRGRTRQ